VIHWKQRCQQAPTKKISKELNEPGLKQRALEYLIQFLAVDGAVDAEESIFLDQAKEALKRG